MIRLVGFDYDDTLVDTLGSRIPAVIEYCKEHHQLEVTQEEVLATWGVPFDQMMHTLGCVGEIRSADYLTIAQNHPLKPFPESDGVLMRLSRQLETAIVTSVAREILDHGLEEFGWYSLISITLAQEDTPSHKPDKRVFEPLIAQAAERGIYPDEIIYVGDRTGDAEAAIAAGIGFIGVARTERRTRQFCELEVRCCPDLIGVEHAICPRELRP